MRMIVCVLEYDDQYVDMDAKGVPRTQEGRVSLIDVCFRGIILFVCRC